MSVAPENDPIISPGQTMPDEELSRLKGTGFSPYINHAESARALAPEGDSTEVSREDPSFAATDPAAESYASPTLEAFPQEQAIVEPPLFQSWSQPEARPPTRTPNFGDLGILGILVSLALAGTILLTLSALHFRLFGVSTMQQANTDIHYSLGSMVLLYLLTFLACLVIFPLVWHKGFFAGLQWNAATALHLRWWLFAAAGICFGLAMIDEVLMPGPPNAPIDKLFQTRLAAWLLFGYGVTLAPFFEEMFFRGFLLPALCTAWDWIIERSTGKPALPLGPNGHPQWSFFAMAVASILTSIPFALMHAEQIAHAVGPLPTLSNCSRFSPASASASASSSSPPAAPATTTSTAAPPRCTPRAAASPATPSSNCWSQPH
jgi:membrane protease YdiL (CAAX protease family)